MKPCAFLVAASVAAVLAQQPAAAAPGDHAPAPQVRVQGSGTVDQLGDVLPGTSGAVLPWRQVDRSTGTVKALPSFLNGVDGSGLINLPAGGGGIASVTATTLGVGSAATATLSGSTLALGLPTGATGATGPAGPTGGVSPQMYGAACDGSTDDTAALQNWAAALSSTKNGFLTGGQCNFSSPIVLPIANNVTIKGSSTTLMYKGSSTTATLLTIGSTSSTPTVDSGCTLKNWVVEDLNIRSTTGMTTGAALKASDLCSSEFRNVNIGATLNSDQSLHIGAWFNGGNTVRWRGGVISAYEALRVNGDPTNQFTDFWLDGGTIINYSTIGLHIAGNVGGFYGIAADIAANNNDVLIDQAQTPGVANLQIKFGSALEIDQTTGGNNTGILVNDAGSGLSTLLLDGTWVASAGQPAGSPPSLTGNCIDIKSGDNWTINVSGGSIVNCNGAGILNESAAAKINVSGTLLWGNLDYAINNYGGGFVTMCGVNFTGPAANAPANTSGTVGSSCNNGQPIGFSPSYTSSGGTGVASVSQTGVIITQGKVNTIYGASFSTTYTTAPTLMTLSLPPGVTCAGPNYLDAINGSTNAVLVAFCNNTTSVTIVAPVGSSLFTASGQTIAYHGTIFAQ